MPNNYFVNSLDSIEINIRSGNFFITKQIIKNLQNNPVTSAEIAVQLPFKNDLMNRINLDFCRNEEYIRKNLAKYYPNLNGQMLSEWEKSKALEMMIIDGEKKYFYNAVPNLFRIDKEAAKVKIAVDGETVNDLKEFCLVHTDKVLSTFNKQKKNLLNPVDIRLKYKLSVDADAVPNGEIVRCWLPFPREDNNRQSNVELLNTNVNEYIIAPEKYLQRSIYMEKKAKAGQKTTFEMELKYTTHAEYYDLSNIETGKYNNKSEFYKHHTSQQAPHIIFSDRIKNITDALVTGIKKPYQKVKKIYQWIDENIPWASALEYSTFANIPEYVLDNKHGDCGMQSLLFITMARYAGIPAKWQSGWMMHPGNVNLHDWAEVYYPNIGWVPLDISFSLQATDKKDLRYFYTSGIDTYRLIVNDDISTDFFPHKIFPRSETIDFQRGEVEWRGGNLYFDKWDYKMKVEYKR